MTICTGYFSDPKIVLGSDMEITGAAKYKGNKHHYKWFDKETGVVVSVYSGLEDDIRNVWERLTEQIEDRDNKNEQIGVGGARKVLEESLKLVKGKRFRMLVAITKEGERPCYLRAAYRTTSPAKNWEIAGGGDVELARYLVGLMDHGTLTVGQAALWSIYIIKTACSYVHGVGQGIRLTIVEDGRLHHVNGDILEDKLSVFEDYISGMWFDFCNLTMADAEYKQRLENVSNAAAVLKGKLPKHLFK